MIHFILLNLVQIKIPADNHFYKNNCFSAGMKWLSMIFLPSLSTY